ncbi:hypothetical protein [Scytonema sp. PRP1]|uniref:hypothetical protein n=1 Tax=Scytonema sp. PRP1 TaxID=3120513 RepID=UPI002FD6CC6A
MQWVIGKCFEQQVQWAIAQGAVAKPIAGCTALLEAIAICDIHRTYAEEIPQPP